MDYIDKILQRANVRQLRTFLLHGMEDLEPEERISAQKLEKEIEPIYTRLEKLCPERVSQDEALHDLHRALAAYEDTYLEVGIIAGARLARQLLG